MSNHPNGRPAFDGDTVSLDLKKAVTIAEFLNRRKCERMQLDFAQCLTLVNEAILLLEGLYVHLPVKRAKYAVDPVRRLQLLKFRLERYDEMTKSLRVLMALFPSPDSKQHQVVKQKLAMIKEMEK